MSSIKEGDDEAEGCGESKNKRMKFKGFKNIEREQTRTGADVFGNRIDR